MSVILFACIGSPSTDIALHDFAVAPSADRAPDDTAPDDTAPGDTARDDTAPTDADGDGYFEDDCDDGNAWVHPGAFDGVPL